MAIYCSAQFTNTLGKSRRKSRRSAASCYCGCEQPWVRRSVDDVTAVHDRSDVAAQRAGIWGQCAEPGEEEAQPWGLSHPTRDHGDSSDAGLREASGTNGHASAAKVTVGSIAGE